MNQSVTVCELDHTTSHSRGCTFPMCPPLSMQARRMQYSQATSCYASFASLLCLPLISQEFFSRKKFSIRIHYHQDFSNRIYLLFALQISPVIHNPKSSPRWTNFAHTQPHSTRPGGNSKSLLTDKRSKSMDTSLKLPLWLPFQSQLPFPLHENIS